MFQALGLSFSCCISSVERLFSLPLNWTNDWNCVEWGMGIGNQGYIRVELKELWNDGSGGRGNGMGNGSERTRREIHNIGMENGICGG